MSNKGRCEIATAVKPATALMQGISKYPK